jgi:hypothetical protein
MDIKWKQHNFRTYDRGYLLEYVVCIFMNSRFVSLLIKDTQCQKLGILMNYKPRYRGRQWSSRNLRYCTGSWYTLSKVTKFVTLLYSRKEIRTHYQPNNTQDRNFRSFFTILSTVYRRLMTSYMCVCVCVFVCVCGWVGFYISEYVYIPHFSYTEVVFKNLSDKEWAGIVLSV